MYSAKRTRFGFSKIYMYPIEQKRVGTFWFAFAIGFVCDERADPDVVFSLARLGVIAIMVLSGDSFRCRRRI
jgi:hypothetical protein